MTATVPGRALHDAPGVTMQIHSMQLPAWSVALRLPCSKSLWRVALCPGHSGQPLCSPIAHERNQGLKRGPVPIKEVKASEPYSLTPFCYLLAPQFQEVFPSTVVRPNYVVPPPKRGRRLTTILSSGEADNTLSSEVESSLSTRRGRTQAAMWLAELPSKHSGFGLSPVGAHP